MLEKNIYGNGFIYSEINYIQLTNNTLSLLTINTDHIIIDMYTL